MDTDALTPGLLQELRATRPYPALSLTMPTHRRAPDNAQDAVRLRNLVTEAGNRLDADPRVTHEARAAVKAQLDRAVAEVDQRRALDSLVILADADEYQIWQLPRTAPERVVLSDSYLTRNLVAAKAGAHHFWVLTISAEHAALWSGTDEALRGGGPARIPPEPTARELRPGAPGQERRRSEHLLQRRHPKLLPHRRRQAARRTGGGPSAPVPGRTAAGTLAVRGRRGVREVGRLQGPEGNDGGNDRTRARQGAEGGTGRLA